MSATVWDVASGELKTSFTRPSTSRLAFQNGFSAVALSPNNASVATGGEDGQIDVWDLPSGRHFAKFLGHRDPVHGLAFDPSGLFLGSAAGGTFDYTARLWDLAGQSAAWTNQINGIGQAVTFSRTGELLAVAAWDHILIIDRGSGKTLKTLEAGNQHQSALAVAFSSDGRLLAAAGDDQITRFWRATTWGLPVQLKEPGKERTVLAVGFAGQGKQLLACGSDGSVTVWDVATQTQRVQVSIGPDPVAVSFSPDGRRVAAWVGNKFGIWELPPF